MLAWEPSQRCTVEQALSHPYLAAFHNPAAEPASSTLFEFDFEDLSENRAQEALFDEVCRFRPELSELRRLREAQLPAAQKQKRGRQLNDTQSSCASAVPGGGLPRYGAQAGKGAGIGGRQPLTQQQQA